MKIHVSVTQDHIDKGRPLSSTGCPVALALKDATGSAAHVGKTSAVVRCGDRWVEAELPDAAFGFVVSHDAGAEVQPFEFDLEVGA